jgi:hypothetical protein
VFNNPLKLVDPDGHCPAPPASMGPAICMALFIAPSSVDVAGGAETLHGDGRGFSSNSDPSKSRGYIWISVSEDKQQSSMSPTGYLFDGIEHIDKPSGNAFWKMPGHTEWVEPSSQNVWTVTRGKHGEVTVTYDLVLAGFLQDIAPHINGTITFWPDGQGGYEAEGERDGFPWAEAYYHDGKGRVKTIFQRPAINGDPENLNALGDGFIQGMFHPFRPFYLGRDLFFASKNPQVDYITPSCVPGRPC